MGKLHSFMESHFFSNGYYVLNRCRNGVLLYNINDLIIGRSLHLWGEFSQKELDSIAPYILPGDTVLDVGAYIGTHSLFFSRLVEDIGVVHAFEPQYYTYQLLQTNLALNFLLNVHSHYCVVGNSNHSIEVPVLDPRISENFGSFSLKSPKVDEIKKREVLPQITIDSLELSNCNFIKLDVEGMELEALKGAEKTIKTYSPTLLVENNHIHRSEELMNYLISLDYKLYWLITPIVEEDNFFGHSIDLAADLLPSINVLCLPPSVGLKTENVIPIEDTTKTWKDVIH